ncbi:MAG TPA: hypothetical protein VJS47_09510 [Rhizomicrobium sp.]|nr:hypothetical protein [Rhizomicrobium sp.]
MADYVTEFAELVSRWRAETALSATAREMMLAPSFSKLVSMNEKIIPLIIEELKRQPSFLFLLLHAITKENPVPQTAQGKIPEIVSAWLTWAARTRRDAA